MPAAPNMNIKTDTALVKKRPEILHEVALVLGSLPAPSPSQQLFSFVSSMHEALLIDEILGSILDHHFESETSAVASKLARTCTAWKDPVLDRVWRTLTDFQPLLATLERAEVRYFLYCIKHCFQADFLVVSRVHCTSLHSHIPIVRWSY